MSWRVGSRLPFVIVTAAGLLVVAGPVNAQVVPHVQDQKLNVQARVGEVCNVTTASLDFGSGITVGPQNQSDASGIIAINCANETTLQVDLNGGLKPGNGATRTMQGPGNDILYILYSDAPGATPWPPGTPVSATISGDGTVPVHGRIPPQENGQLQGVYTDEVTITLSF